MSSCNNGSTRVRRLPQQFRRHECTCGHHNNHILQVNIYVFACPVRIREINEHNDSPRNSLTSQLPTTVISFGI